VADKQSYTDQIYEQVTNQFIESLKEGRIPWKKPWNPLGAHRNYISGNVYRGINPLLLDISTMANDFNSPLWLTYKQANSLSCKAWCKKNGVKNDKLGWKKYKSECRKNPEAYTGVREGETGTIITFWKTFVTDDIDKMDEDGNFEKKVIPLLRKIQVFNVEQTDLNIVVDEIEKIEFNPIEKAEEVIEGWENKPEIIHSGDRACFIPSEDKIKMPKRESFHSVEEYYKTLFHECVHGTGHKSRLNRIKHDNFGDEEYSKEELVAEIGASFLTNYCEIENDDMTTNSVSYINGWISKLQSDPKLIVQAGGKAQKAVDMILGIEYTYEDQKEKE
jgi:antirestriction protein ArdC